ncbi:MAG: DUF1540 domain-containing protein [Muribaculaceae bacterium]|nr:DUF1540 domain-containing protein [Roseburia sp.]MCM1431151.1 DUF1540 domain-containing protein [Muribaculaceae bacterium]MCM1492574.1 DUF1540 domain-containing protein [Muribaculaceae bacterium]
MTVLDCNVVNCTYNDDNSCRRRDIHVEGAKAKTPSETCCGSYARKGCSCGANSMGEAEKDTQVACEACDCRFNENRTCSAAHIGISGGHADSSRSTECGSFQCYC